MAANSIDYDALAKQHGAVTPSVDYDALAKQHGAVSSSSPSSSPTAPAVDALSPSTWTLEHNPISHVLAGIGSGAISSAVGAYNLARKIPGAEKILPPPSDYVNGLEVPPPDWMGSLGKGAEQVAEFVAPMGAAADAAKLLPLAGKAATVAKLGAEAMTAGGVAGVQTGGSIPAIEETAATTAALGGLGAAIPAGAKAALTKAIQNGVRPLSEGAQAIAKKYGVPLTQGMLSGSKTIQAIEKMAGHTVASDLYEPLLADAQTGLTAGATDLAGQTDKFSAGQKTMDHLLGAAEDHTNTAAAEYGNLKALEADPKNARPAQVGMKVNLSQDPNSPALIPDVQPMGLPTNMKPVKAAIMPEIEDLERAMTPAQRNMDPGLTALKNIMSRPDALPASVAERDLGYLKEIQRSDASAQSKRLATIAANALQPAIDSAVSIGGPGAVESLQNARGSWAARSSILDDLKSISGDVTGKSGQVRTAETLLAPGDRNFPMLERTLLTAPAAAQELGQSYLRDRVFGKVISSGDDFTNARQAANLWNQLGTRTKQALFDDSTIKNVNDFLELSKRVGENPNPSGTGTINSLLKLGAMIGHPVQAAATFSLGRQLAKTLYNPEAAGQISVKLTPAAQWVLRRAQAAINATEAANAPAQ